MPKQSSSKYSITVNNRKYEYSLKPIGKLQTRVVCSEANIDQNFLNQDVPALLFDLPNLILAEKEYKDKQEEVIRFRVSTADKKEIEKKAIKKGYKTVSTFLRELALSA
ncbi:MAG: hypothetical protein WC897_05090 [Candidatus Gracilibacteria bacterium]